jgi:hypothetical protein
MNPELLAHLTGSRSLSPDDRAALASMAADPMAALRARLDPDMRELLDMMQAHKAQQPVEAETVASEPGTPDFQPIRIDDGRPRQAPPNPRLRFLEMVNRATAGALGACARCWGRDSECPRCEGFGLPGAAAPDPQLFRALVLPAIRAAEAGQVPGFEPEPDHPAGKPRQSTSAPAGDPTDQPKGEGHV